MFLKVFVSLVPLATIYFAWHFARSDSPALSKLRERLFRTGLLLCAVCSISIVSCWMQPFALISDGRGGYSDARETWLYFLALATAMLTVLLAGFGRGTARLSLLAGGVLLLVLAFWVFLANGV